MFAKLLETVEQEISSTMAFQHLAEIHRTDRWFTFPKFGETAEYCVRALKGIGAADVELLELQADGRTPYGDWVIPQAWDAVAAELQVVQPEEAAGRIARYGDCPCCLVMYSAPTPAGGIKAELVSVADRAELERADVRGKVVLVPCRPKEILDLAEKKGAMGIVSDHLAPLPRIRERMDLPDAVRWENDCFVPLNEGKLFAFSISPRSGDFLRSLVRKEAAKGRAVRLFARVETRLYDGTAATVSGLLPGRGKEEIIVCTHLYEPGASDNASGCAVSLEAARCLNTLISSGRLPRPRRGMRFIFGWECAGFMGYAVGHADRLSNMVAGLNIDMVGGNQARNRAYLHMRNNPHSNASYTDFLLARIIEFYQKERNPLLRWEEDKCGLCDNLFADPMIGVPVPSLIQFPDIVWHSSADTLDRIDPQSLKQVATMAATYLYFVADAGNDEALWLASAAVPRATQRLWRQAERVLAGMNNDLKRSGSADEWEMSRARLKKGVDYRLDREMHALDSILRLVDKKEDSKLNRQVGDLRREIRAAGEATTRRAEQIVNALARRAGIVLLPGEEQAELSPEEKKAAGIIPARSVFGSLTFFPLPTERRRSVRWDPYYNYGLNCPLFWADGKRSLLEISRLAEEELGEVSLRDLLEYFEFLAEQGYVKLNRRSR